MDQYGTVRCKPNLWINILMRLDDNSCLRLPQTFHSRRVCGSNQWGRPRWKCCGTSWTFPLMAGSSSSATRSVCPSLLKIVRLNVLPDVFMNQQGDQWEVRSKYVGILCKCWVYFYCGNLTVYYHCLRWSSANNWDCFFRWTASGREVIVSGVYTRVIIWADNYNR